ncbi:MAG: AbrB/MazE/SpoVT family DNA-binding domain-containing protein [Clostridia bacterium]|jgi:transcriptional pleiotropic regulator of transition state genes
MKSTGIVRKVDELGRVVIPKETREQLSVEEKDALEIFVDEKSIILKKYAPGCIFCGQMNGVKDFRGKLVCNQCIAEITQRLEE